MAAALLLAVLAGLPHPAAAVNATPFDECFAAAARHYRVPLALLQTIATVESSLNPHARNTNRNGTEDIGIMQINSSWLPKLQRFGVGKAELLDPCINIQIGAWILAHNISTHGSTWKAIGAYNARSADKQELYAEKVRRRLMKAWRPR